EWFGNGAPKPTATNQPTVPPGTFQLTEADREVARACGLSDEEMVTTKVRDFMRNAERQGFTPTPQGNTMYQATLTEADRQVARQFGLSDAEMLEAKRQEHLPLDGRNCSAPTAQQPQPTVPQVAAAGITLTAEDREVARQFGWS